MAAKRRKRHKKNQTFLATKNTNARQAKERLDAPIGARETLVWVEKLRVFRGYHGLKFLRHKPQNQAHAFEHQHTVATRSDGATRRPLGFGILSFGIFLGFGISGFGILRSAHWTSPFGCGCAALRSLRSLRPWFGFFAPNSPRRLTTPSAPRYFPRVRQPRSLCGSA